MYRKHIYWVDDPEEAEAVIKSRGIDVFRVKKAVCIPLAENFELGVIPPETWSEYQFCRRQYSWYHQSQYAGMTLIISSIELPGIRAASKLLITDYPQLTPPDPGLRDIEDLAGHPEFKKMTPPAWNRINDAESSTWFKVMKIEGIEPDALLEYHSANHANFIHPKFFIKNSDGPTPCSIGPTSRVCSSCLELFNIIGSAYDRKLVIPCPGAVRFAGLKKNKYYKVVTL